MTTRLAGTLAIALSAATLGLFLLLALESGRGEMTRGTYHAVTLQQARGAQPLRQVSSTATRSVAAWCGTRSATDLVPNALAGHPVHWIYMTPSDEPDQLATYGNVMQADAESIDGWWRAHDASRTLRNDVAQFSCGTQLDLTTISLHQPGAQLASVETRPDTIASSLLSLGFASRTVKYVVYYDGPVEREICGQGGPHPSGVGFAFVYVRACPGVPFATTAAHELMHAMGAVAGGAPHLCAPDDGHVCDNAYDMMYPYGDETPIGGLALDSGRDDYYGHSGSWLDIRDEPWLVQLDRQAQLTLTMTGSGTVAANVPGLTCTKTCTTTWNADTPLSLTATPAPGAKLVAWGSTCSGTGLCNIAVVPGRSVSVLFAPMTYRLTVTVTGKGLVRSSRPGIACAPRCSASVPSHAPFTLTAKAAKGWRFKTWKGACRGTRSSCSLPMAGDTAARAVIVRA